MCVCGYVEPGVRHSFIKTKIQRGSEICTSLDFEWSKSGWVAKDPDIEWDQKSGSQLFEIWTNGCHFVKNHLKYGQKCLDFEWCGSNG